MDKNELRNFIISTTLSNTNAMSKMGDSKFDTKDLIFLDSADEVKAYNDSREECITSATSWALINGAFEEVGKSTITGKDGGVCCWLRSANSFIESDIMNYNGNLDYYRVDDFRITLCPAMRLNLSSVISARNESDDNFKINVVKDRKDIEQYHTIKFGEYPKSSVSMNLNDELENAYILRKTEIKPTGKKYLGRISSGGLPSYYKEFEYKGSKYVRVDKKPCNDENFNEYKLTCDYKSVHDVNVCEDLYDDYFKEPNWTWIKVEPITWKIRNWKDMPTTINPTGNGSATFIDVRTEEAIACLPFYPNNKDKKGSLWQNSTIRGYLNGYNVNNIKLNGCSDYTADNGGDFSKHNFLTEAFANQVIKLKEISDDFELTI